jgi:hypothetical protein
MGLDLRIYNPNDHEDSQFFFGNECGSVMRLVKDMNHYDLVGTSGKTLREVKLDILRHVGEMITQLETFDYVPTKSRHEFRWEITLQSDLEVMAQLVGELNKMDVPDNWIVEWDY